MFDRQAAESNGDPAAGGASPGDPALGDNAPAGSPTDGIGPRWDLEQLIREHHASLYRYAYRLSGNATDAEDLTQQAFATAHEKLHQVRDAENVRGWLFTVVRNCFLKSCRRPRPISADAMDYDLAEVPDTSLAEPVIDGERLQQALDELPEEFRLVLVMFYFEECPYKEIAEKLELPLGTVMSRLSRAKQRLRQRLAEIDPERNDSNAADSAESRAAPRA